MSNTDKQWNRLTPEELAKLRKKMKKNATWTPSAAMIFRELESLGRGIRNKNNFRDQWEGKPEQIIEPEDGGFGDPRQVSIDDNGTLVVNKGMQLNMHKKRKRQELIKEMGESETPDKGRSPKMVKKERTPNKGDQLAAARKAKRMARKKKEEEWDMTPERSRRSQEDDDEAVVKQIKFELGLSVSYQ
ncbi:hypothetical protein BZA77DRAFT_317848 [Pyronema omphalodes]|nr:hypothetical protein BZA77DRAFT_317848 [Pyronema omphalodes]